MRTNRMLSHKRHIISVISIILVLAIVVVPDQGLSDATRGQDSAIITDVDGRQWDITHARDIYGMDPNYFNFGIGVGSIPSINNPRIISSCDPDYPDHLLPLRIFGVSHNGIHRAYLIADLVRHEIVNDFFPGKKPRHVAITH